MSIIDKDIELKPCPFCGTNAMFVGGGTSRYGRLAIHVECASRLCLATTKSTYSAEASAKIWNMRYNDDK